MAPETAATRPARKGPRLRQWRPASRSGATAVGAATTPVATRTSENVENRMVQCPSMSVDALPYGPYVPHRPHLDAPGLDPGELRRDADRLFDVFGLDQVEAREHLLRLGERPVDDGAPAIADAHGLGRRGALEHLGVEQAPVLAQVVGVRETVAHVRIELTRRQSVEQGGVGIDEDGEFHAANIASPLHVTVSR